MLDPQILGREPARVARACQKRGVPFEQDAYTRLRQQCKTLRRAVEELQHKRTLGAKTIARAMQEQQDVAPIKHEMRLVQQKIKQHKEELDTALARLHSMHLQLPNLVHDSVPAGQDETSNRREHTWGEKPQFTFAPKEHYELLPGLLDPSMASRLAGTRFTLLRGELALLHRALIQMMLDVHIHDHGYTEIYVPVLVNQQALINSGQLPKFAEDLFHLTDTNYALIPTAEVPLVNLAADRIFKPDQLPIKVTAHSSCFRSEAGSYGKDVRGMLRLHQFDKVELVQIVHPDTSWDALEEMCKHAQTILQKLNLPYRVMTLCAGDMGYAAAKTYDLEVWLPGQNTYREVSSCSNCTDFQARRMQARLDVNGKKVPVHTLNASGLAVGRTLIAIMENYQTKDGGVKVPEALRSYVDLAEIRPSA